jgi:hypothetical protein
MFFLKDLIIIEIRWSWAAFRAICCSIELWRRFMLNDECWDFSRWCDLWIVHLTIISKRDAKFAERRTTECLTRCTHYANADNECRANKFEWSWRFLNETKNSDHQWEFFWWRTCTLEWDSFLFRSSSSKSECDYFSKNDASCLYKHWFMISEQRWCQIFWSLNRVETTSSLNLLICEYYIAEQIIFC